MGKESNIKTTIKQNEVLNFILNHPGEYSYDEIGQIFNINAKTIRSTYGKLFVENGISTKSRNKKFFADKIEKELKIIRQMNFSKEEVKKCYIAFIIKKQFFGKVQEDKLIDALINRYLYDGETLKITKDDYTDKGIKKENDKHNNKKIYIKKLLNQMEESKLIKSQNKQIILFEKNELMNLDEYGLQEFLVYLSVLKEIHPKVSLYKRIFSKLSIMCPNFKENVITVDKLNGLSIFDELKVEKIEQAIYEKKKICFIYKNNTTENKKTAVPLGVIYNDYKDQWYVNADTYIGNRNKKENQLLRLDKIINLEVIEDEESGSFNKEWFENAIGVNLSEKQIEVEVYFENKEFIRRKVEVYCRDRKLASITNEKDRFLLRDSICGETEFETWLRGFGKSALCIKPESLIKKINGSLDKMIERYKVNE